jgi:hypothetical protein
VLADLLTGELPRIDAEFHGKLKRVFSDGELLDLGMTIVFFSGLQRFNEAFGIVPDGWTESDPLPFGPSRREPRRTADHSSTTRMQHCPITL